MLPIKTIVHPTDFSENSYLAFRLACSLAHDYGARLIVAHVAEIPVAIYGEGVMMFPPDIDRVSLRERLRHLKPESPSVRTEYQLIEGDAPTGIVNLAQEESADVIVMGTHGRSGIGRLLMGSVAEKVLRTAPCPVVTVKSPLSPRHAAEKSAAAASSEPEKVASR